jgi:acyl carrier protein
LGTHRERALAAVAKVAAVEVAALEPHMDLVADLGVDSPRALQLLVELEERLGFEISDEEAARLTTVADVLALADRQR